LTVSWDYPVDLPILWTDDEKLKAVIQNLINNAIKFTEKGKVTVAVRHLAQTRAIEFKISDTGIGIPKEKVETVFDMFQQVDSSATRKFGGVGLGLYIVRKFTELLGGTVAVESEFERGSTFTVTLPIQAVAPGQAKRKREPLRDGAPDF
jgi:two-component system, sensor histidine kinase